jgi:hypothetical protein
LREKYCWLVDGGWFVLRKKYCWLIAHMFDFFLVIWVKMRRAKK